MLSSLGFLLFAADSLGRRKSLLMSSVGQALTLYMIAIYQKVYPGNNSSVSMVDLPLNERRETASD